VRGAIALDAVGSGGLFGEVLGEVVNGARSVGDQADVDDRSARQLRPVPRESPLRDETTTDEEVEVGPAGASLLPDGAVLEGESGELALEAFTEPGKGVRHGAVGLKGAGMKGRLAAESHEAVNGGALEAVAETVLETGCAVGASPHLAGSRAETDGTRELLPEGPPPTDAHGARPRAFCR